MVDSRNNGGFYVDSSRYENVDPGSSVDSSGYENVDPGASNLSLEDLENLAALLGNGNARPPLLSEEESKGTSGGQSEQVAATGETTTNSQGQTAEPSSGYDKAVAALEGILASKEGEGLQISSEERADLKEVTKEEEKSEFQKIAEHHKKLADAAFLQNNTDAFDKHSAIAELAIITDEKLQTGTLADGELTQKTEELVKRIDEAPEVKIEVAQDKDYLAAVDNLKAIMASEEGAGLKISSQERADLKEVTEEEGKSEFTKIAEHHRELADAALLKGDDTAFEKHSAIATLATITDEKLQAGTLADGELTQKTEALLKRIEEAPEVVIEKERQQTVSPQEKTIEYESDPPVAATIGGGGADKKLIEGGGSEGVTSDSGRGEADEYYAPPSVDGGGVSNRPRHIRSSSDVTGDASSFGADTGANGIRSGVEHGDDMTAQPSLEIGGLAVNGNHDVDMEKLTKFLNGKANIAEMLERLPDQGTEAAAQTQAMLAQTDPQMDSGLNGRTEVTRAAPSLGA